MIDTPKTSHYFFIRMEPSCPQPLETCHSPGIIPDIYSCGENCLDTLIKNLNGKPQMDKKNNQNWGQLPDYLWVETATSVCFHSNYVNLHPCMHSLWEAQMRGAEQNRETLQDRAVGWEAHLEIEAPQCSLQQSPSSPAEAVWGSIATAVPSLYKLLLSQKCQTCGVSVLPVTAQLYVPNKVLWQDEKANVREQGLLREKFCELVIEVIVSGKKRVADSSGEGPEFTHQSLSTEAETGERNHWDDNCQKQRLSREKGDRGQRESMRINRLGKSTRRKARREDRAGEVI